MACSPPGAHRTARVGPGGAPVCAGAQPRLAVPAAGSSRSCTQQVLGELRGPGEQLPVGGDDQRVAVEDQLVLAADHVHVRDGRPGLGGPAPHQGQPHVVLVQLVRRAVDVDHQAHAGPAGRGERAAGLPEVLADGQCHVDPAEPDHGQAVARLEVAVLVEDAVVGQVVLEVGGDHVAAEQQRAGVARPAAGGGVGAGRRRTVGVEVADDDRQVAQTVRGQVGGEVPQRRSGRLDERTPEDEVLDRVPGEHHLGERDELGAGVGGGPGPAAGRSRRCRRGRRRSGSPGRGRGAGWAWRHCSPAGQFVCPASPAVGSVINVGVPASTRGIGPADGRRNLGVTGPGDTADWRPPLVTRLTGTGAGQQVLHPKPQAVTRG